MKAKVVQETKVSQALDMLRWRIRKTDSEDASHEAMTLALEVIESLQLELKSVTESLQQREDQLRHALDVDRASNEPPAAPNVRQVLRRVVDAVKALGAMEDGKTLFESSPSKSKAAFEAWLALNEAVAKANYVLEQPASTQPPSADVQMAMAMALISEVDCHLANAKWQKDATARRKLRQAHALLAPTKGNSL